MIRIKYLFFFLLFILAVLFSFLKHQEEKRLIHVMKTSSAELQQKVKNAPIQQDNDLGLQFTQKQQNQLRLLQTNFESYTYNGEGIWLKHQDFIASKTQDSLMAIINQEGGISLFSNYIGAEPIMHYAIQLKVGETYIDSIQVMPSMNPASTIGITQIHESICLKAEHAKTLIEQIALNKDVEIEVRLIGKTAFSSFLLTEKSKKAFSETWELFNLLTV